ncbi:alkaline shock response membrane anchor protein AmaP [Frankia sp. AiPs1]|uniref:alkaline shock response membrane anchor protein AmaP n=1 Tax=Frankia sp. AiPs1 TaxID=573493 RepID=UPI002043DC3E|nr:alkaline shock response membrane anchor protein AmaP [Frankia sp. AiPs1]MCM3923698.1 alkaline shock response membrane anchor protein AmaP [Frankia sp. AiPs1]
MTGAAPCTTDRRNRVILAVLGVLLTAAGVVALLVGVGLFGDGRADQSVLDPDVRGFAADHGWFWPVVGVGCGLIALLALVWLTQQMRTDRSPGLDVTHDELGDVHLPAAALTDAVADDVAGIAGVEGARAELRGRSEPSLDIAVRVTRGTDVQAVAGKVCGPVLGRARRALGRPDLPAQVNIRPVGVARRRRRVR